MKDTLSNILSNRHISEKFWQMRVETGWKNYVPGQFVMFRVPGNKTFLRRPFSIARMKDGVIEICYKVIGAGTEAMSGLKVGERVNVLGPLGNGFQISDVVARLALPKSGRASSATTQHLLVAGGYGVAPLLGLAEQLKGGDIHLFYGAKTGSELLYLNEFKEIGVEIHIATEDGTMGEKGLVTDTLKRFLLSAVRCPPSTVFACGPHGMLKTIKSSVVDRRSLVKDCQLSLESYMGCGYGVCMGCAVKLKNGEYARVCKDGPVFDVKCLSVEV